MLKAEMQPITARRETTIDMPWRACARELTAILMSEEWSSDRTTLVGRTHLHFAVAVRHMDAATDSLLFHLMAASPELHSPLTGYVEARPAGALATALTVLLTANLDDEPTYSHLSMRESIASLADVLSRTIENATRPPSD